MPHCKSLKKASEKYDTHANFSSNLVLCTEVCGQKVGEHATQGNVFLSHKKCACGWHRGNTVLIHCFSFFLSLFLFLSWISKLFGGWVFSHRWQTKLVETLDNWKSIEFHGSCLFINLSGLQELSREHYGWITIITPAKGKVQAWPVAARQTASSLPCAYLHFPCQTSEQGTKGSLWKVVFFFCKGKKKDYYNDLPPKEPTQ